MVTVYVCMYVCMQCLQSIHCTSAFRILRLLVILYLIVLFRLPPFNVSISKFPNYEFMEKRCSNIDALMDSTSNGHDGKMEYEYDYQSKDILEVLEQALHGLDPDIIIINNGLW